ncbi:MAG: NTP transferase domain-containing protein [Candidatus Eisenbacteria bacterium]|uniref:NTP transferase domain-containing protein n=1 Tax=Eiseniibacteriota bacterium TaxID=2212470 RepID=A0A938BQY1_UNCEI|nr:NTP transferase domain-containing protein [Candidatus Eisenbacteria bacterium]
MSVAELAIVILAAGKGTRMPADMPKVLRPAAGEPLLAHVLRCARALAPRRLVVVLGHGLEAIRRAIPLADGEVALQEEQRGTGDAVRCALPSLEGFSGDLLVLYGDVPLLRPATLQELLERHRVEENAATILTATLDEPGAYGRIVRDRLGFCSAIVERRDLAPGQEGIREINSGIIAFAAADLRRALPLIGAANRQGEYYLTDVIGLLRREGRRVGTHHLRDAGEILGVNTPADLAEVERIAVARGPAGGAGCPLCRAQAAAAAGGSAGVETLLLAAGERVCVRVADTPFNNGHLLVFPRRHVASFPALTAEERDELEQWVRRSEAALASAYACDALNLGYNSGAGGHLAFQIIPRWRGDINYLPLIAGLKLIPERPCDSWERLRRVFP